MSEFFTVLTPADALETLFRNLPAPSAVESIATEAALDRTTAEMVVAPHDLPAFPRSTMDGYAVRARDTFGASQSLPAYLNIIGEILMGAAPAVELAGAQAVLVHTGGMLPETADAVVMVENTQPSRDGEIEVLKSVAVGENLLQVGEDYRAGAALLPAGHRLRPQDLGGLLAMGIVEIKVARAPIVGIIATGDEIVSPEKETGLGQVRDINTYTVAALVEHAGGIPKKYGIVPDDRDELENTAASALQECDAVVISAGSSVSVRDMTADVLATLGKPGVLVHGVAVKPGKPTILAVAAGKPIFGLPGNPVSAMVVADIFLVPTLYHLQGLEAPDPRVVRARLTANVASTAGREDYVPGRFVPSNAESASNESKADQVWIEPVFGKSNLIFTLVNADGAIMIPLNSNGLNRGELVDVRLF